MERKFLSLILIVLMLVALVSCSKPNNNLVSTTPSESTSTTSNGQIDFPNDKTVAEILCDYLAKLVNENKDMGPEELAELWAEHPYIEELNVFSYSFGYQTPLYVPGISDDAVLPNFKSVTILEPGVFEKIFSAAIFSFDKGADIDGFVSALEVSKNMSFHYNGEATEACILKIGNYAVMVLTTEDIRIEIDTDPNRQLNAKEVLKLVKKAAEIRNVSVLSLDLSDEYNQSQVGIKSSELVENTGSICEPNMGFGFSLSMVKVIDEANAVKIAKEMENGLNPNKWICVTAGKVLVVVNGKYVLGIMGSPEECDTISKAFLEMDFDN